MSPRFKTTSFIGSLATASLIWLSGAEQVAAVANRPLAPAPCSPDGDCRVKTDTWGWYQTRWRSFPGDQVRPTPTPAAEAEQQEAEKQRELEQSGPKLPSAAEEASVGPRKAAPAASPPGEAPPNGEIEPVPATDDPLGMIGPPAPAWLGVSDVTPEALPNPTETRPAMARPATAAAPALPGDAPSAQSQQAVSAPGNLGSPPPATPAMAIPGDSDEPPSLPAYLRQQALGFGPAPSQASYYTQAAAAGRAPIAHAPLSNSLTGPAGWSQSALRTDGHVTPASSAEGIQLVNPAATFVAAPGEGGIRPAVYYEATDRSTERPAQLPPVP